MTDDTLVKSADIDGAVAAYYSWRQVDKSNFISYMFPESDYDEGRTVVISRDEIRQSVANIMTWPASTRSEFLIRISRVPERSA